jgi:mono/diheme cytochrome c family protein
VTRVIGACWILLLCLPVRLAAQAPDSIEPMLSQTNEDGQPARMPPLPPGVTLGLVRSGDSVFHGKGHCFACHGADAEGLSNAGSALTVGLNFVSSDVEAIDSIIVYGIPEPITRSAIAMPARGGKSDLSTDECLAAAAYVWVISQARGEPWPGGHRTHVNLVPAAALTGTAADLPPGADYAPP